VAPSALDFAVFAAPFSPSDLFARSDILFSFGFDLFLQPEWFRLPAGVFSEAFDALRPLTG